MQDRFFFGVADDRFSWSFLLAEPHVRWNLGKPTDGEASGGGDFGLSCVCPCWPVMQATLSIFNDFFFSYIPAFILFSATCSNHVPGVHDIPDDLCRSSQQNDRALPPFSPCQISTVWSSPASFSPVRMTISVTLPWRVRTSAHPGHSEFNMCTHMCCHISV